MVFARSSVEILKELSRDQPCDITGISDYAMIEDAGGIQWPLPDSGNRIPHEEDKVSNGSEPFVATERRLFEDGAFYHADKKAKFLFEAPRDVPEITDVEYPFISIYPAHGAWDIITMAHADAYRKIRRIEEALSRPDLRGDKSGRRETARHRGERNSHSGVAPRTSEGDSLCHKYGSGRPSLYPDALCGCKRTYASRV